MRLTYLVANAAYVFTFGDQIIPMGDHGRFFARRADAIEAARLQGLKVSRAGIVSADGPNPFDAEQDPRYIVQDCNGWDVISRPCVIDTRDGSKVCEPWSLNDWDRAEEFAAELNAIESGSDNDR